MTESIALTLTGHLAPDQTLTYIYVPFDVPAGTGRIDVSYSYDAGVSSDPTVTGGNTVDIGIFDPRGVDFMTEGFRGWSGSAKKAFFVGREEATPGYMPGPIQAGLWQVCLGAYKVAPQGCHYKIQVTLTPTLEKRAIGFPALLRLSDAPVSTPPAKKWFKGELHCHTIHSDGDSTPLETVRKAESLGLDFLAITDHNNMTHLADLAQIDTPLILIPGYEVTTYYGHWNIWGDGGWIDFRIQSEGDLQQAIEEANRRGYLASCNHPKPYGPDWAFADVEGYACVEVWNGPWELFNSHALAFWQKQLARGQRLSAVGGSDSHFLHREHSARLGYPTTYISCDAPVSAAGLLRSVRAAHTFVTESPEGPQLYLRAGEAMMGDAVKQSDHQRLAVDVHVIDGAGAQVEIWGQEGMITSADVDRTDQRFEWELDVSQTCFVRAQLVWPDGTVRAVCNPIYII